MMRSAVLLALLMPCAALRTSSMKKARQDGDEIELDSIDKMEYEGELELAKDFLPSTELITAWKEAARNKGPSADKSFAKTGVSLPDQCADQIQKWVLAAQPHGPAHPDEAWIKEHAECQDPFAGRKDMCSKGYEVPLYRLADVVLYRPKNLPEFLTNFFPGSIAAKYVEKTKARAQIDVLNEIISGPEYDKFDKPAADELVVHLRLGDTFPEFLRNDHFYEHLIPKVKEAGIKKVTLVYGDHTITQMAKLTHQEPTESTATTGPRWKWKGEYLKKALARIPQVERIFTKSGLPVEKRINFNADCDIVYMANAKHFMKAGGGLSKLVSTLAHKRGGQILGN